LGPTDFIKSIHFAAILTSKTVKRDHAAGSRQIGNNTLSNRVRNLHENYRGRSGHYLHRFHGWCRDSQNEVLFSLSELLGGALKLLKVSPYPPKVHFDISSPNPPLVSQLTLKNSKTSSNICALFYKGLVKYLCVAFRQQSEHLLAAVESGHRIQPR
jgi:hypothetical protein